MDKQEKCPRCGCENNVIGVQSSYGRVCADTRFFGSGQTLYHVICLQCGNVIRSYVKNPERLIVRK